MKLMFGCRSFLSQSLPRLTSMPTIPENHFPAREEKRPFRSYAGSSLAAGMRLMMFNRYWIAGIGAPDAPGVGLCL